MPPQIHPRELAKKIANGHIVHLLDVRQPQERDLAVLPGSILIPLAELPGRVAELPFPKEELVVVFCHHGVRSLAGANVLLKSGYTNVVSLAGGIDAWSTAVDPDVPRY